MLGFICIHYTHSLKHLFSSVYSVPIRQVHWTQSQLIVQCNYNCLSVVNHYNLDIFYFHTVLMFLTPVCGYRFLVGEVELEVSKQADLVACCCLQPLCLHFEVA